ncbi:armadillo-type protein [Mycena albidolilacea]|uniref:Armadillo-type protein n=1 Tax=Mycena albidolilacea TaxID=1033008 RepID=A0AAD7ADD1_9AGAR|nr:armadillo-type protein [Mycena albidolilacea]
MPPLTRQDSRPSIHSWWSDSNPGLQGPTINLHAAAKPLMRLMYYRQASDILRKNRGSSLTTAILETYASYFPWDYVSWATKAAILSELADRVKPSEVEARAVVDSPVFPHIMPMFESPDPRARICSCHLLGNLAWFESTAPAVLELKLCEQLVFLLDNKHSGVIREATAALTHLSRWVDGAKGVVDAKALDHVLRLLESPNPDTQRWACELVGCVATHEATSHAVLQLKPCKQIVSLLGDEDSLAPYVTYALSQIARWVDGAKGVVDAKVLDHVLRLLESPNLDTRRWACKLVGNVATHEATSHAVLQLKPCEQIVSLLGDEDSLAPYVIYALSQIAQWVDGAKGVVDTKVLDHVLGLLESPNPDTQRWGCELVGYLASHESTAPTLLWQLNPCEQIVSLLGDEDSLVTWATYALSQIARWPDGAKGVVDAKALDHVLPLLKSLNPDIRKWACELTGNLADHKSTTPAILELNTCVQLVSFLGDEDYVVSRAIDEDSLVPYITYALSQIARWVDGAKGVVDAKVLDHVLRLLKSPNPDTRRWACELVGRVATHEATAPAFLQLKPCEQIVSLLGDEDYVVHRATFALSRIAYWVDGAKAVIDTKALNHILRLLESPNPDTRRWACELAGHLALHESTTSAIFKLTPSVQLVSLLGDKDYVVCRAMFALSRIACWVYGATAVVDAKALNHVLRLLESPNPDSRRSACELVGHVATHEATAPAVLQLKPCEQIVSLLGDEDSSVPYVTHALSQIARWVDGAKGVVDAKALDHILRLLKSPNPDTRRWACELVGRAATHETTSHAVLQLKPCEQIVSLLGDEDYVVRRATFALSRIACWINGAKAVVDAKVLDHVLLLLKSPNPDTRRWACELVRRIASHEATAPAILELKPIPQLESLLQDSRRPICDSAISALEAIRQWPDGVDVAAPTDSDGVL